MTCIAAQLGQPFHGWPSFKDVTVPRVAIFRDAIVDLFDMELGTRHIYRWILHHLISEIPIYLCYKIVILPSGKRMLSACSRRVRKGSEERKCPAYLYAQRVFFKLEWLMFVMFPRSFLFGMFANSWVSVLRKLEPISYCLGSQVVYCSFSSISCWFDDCIFCWEMTKPWAFNRWDCGAKLDVGVRPS